MAIKRKVTERRVKDLAKILEESGAVLPLMIYSTAFRYILNGVVTDYLVKGTDVGPKNTYESAAEEYLFMYFASMGEPAKDVEIVQPQRIVDATGKIVYMRTK